MAEQMSDEQFMRVMRVETNRVIFAMVFGMLIMMLVGVWFGAAFAIGECAKNGSYVHRLLAGPVYCSITKESSNATK